MENNTEPATKKCGRCQTVKTIDNFSKYEITNKKHSSECRECHTKRLREYTEKNKEKVKEHGRKYRQSEHGISVRKKYYKTITEEQKRKKLLHDKYKITPEYYNSLFDQQKGICKICKSPPKDKYLVIDHDHQTGEIRGLLCQRCNKTLGFAGDTIEKVQRFIDYLLNK